jgi:hypothetical protein
LKTAEVHQEGELMPKEKKTAQELADMIKAEINVGGTFIKVHADKVYGWHPTVVAAPQLTPCRRRLKGSPLGCALSMN